MYGVCRTVEVNSVWCMQDGGGGPCMMYAGRWRWAEYDAGVPISQMDP